MKSRIINENKDASLGYILGTVMGDGWYGFYGRSNYVIGLKVKDKDFADEFCSALKDIGLRPKISLYDDFYRLVAHSKNLHTYLNGANNNFVMRQSGTFKKMFLRGLFDSDGWVSQSNLSNPHFTSRVIGLANSDKNLIELTQKLLKDLEIKFKTKSRIHSGFGSKKIQYELIITGKNNFRKYSIQIGFSIKRKQDTLEKLLNSFRTYIRCLECKNIVSLSEHQPAIKYCRTCSINKNKIYKKKYRNTVRAKEYDKLYIKRWRKINREKYNDYMKKYHRNKRSKTKGLIE